MIVDYSALSAVVAIGATGSAPGLNVPALVDSGEATYLSQVRQ